MNVKRLLFLFRKVKIKSIPKGEIILPKKSTRKELYFIRKGLVRSFLINDKGDEITFQLYSETQTFTNIHAILLNEASKFSYQAIENTKVYCINYDEFRKATSTNKELFELSRTFIGKKMIKQAFLRTESFVFLNPEERYKKFIKDNPKLANRVPDMYLANVLGITPVSLSRIRKRIVKKK